MTQFKDNETVTISLERYEELKNDVERLNNLENPFPATSFHYRAPSYEEVMAYRKYFQENGLELFYTPHKIEVVKNDKQ